MDNKDYQQAVPLIESGDSGLRANRGRNAGKYHKKGGDFLSRRSVLELGLMGVTGLAGVMLTPKFQGSGEEVKPKDAESLPVLTPVEVKQKPEHLVKLDLILSLALDDPLRLDQEKKYVEGAKTREQIDAGFWVIKDKECRAKLLNARFDLRKNSEQVWNPEQLAKIEWALKNRIHPEILFLSEESYKTAKLLINQILQQDKSVRPDLQFKVKNKALPANFLEQITAEQIMISPGGLAKLICEETAWGFARPKIPEIDKKWGQEILQKFGYIKDHAKRAKAAEAEYPPYTGYGFSNIGEGSARKNVKAEYYGPAYASDYQLFENKLNQDFRALAEILTKVTGLNFTNNIDNIPGSNLAEGAISGGAINNGMMVNNHLKIEALLKGRGFDYNPMDIFSASVGSLVFLSLAEQPSGVDGFRWGWLNGDTPMHDAIKMACLNKWNGDQNEQKNIKFADDSYRKNFSSRLTTA